MSDKFYLVSSDNVTVPSTRLLKPDVNDYLSYSIFTETTNNSDEPKENKYGLFDLFDGGFDLISADGNKITISEKITAEAQILSHDNYDKITSIFGNITPAIDYDGINDMLLKIDNSMSYAEISSVVFTWLGKFMDFTINKNPEKADESNYILTQSLIDESNGQSYVQKLIESILNKVFRNLMQLVRVKHDYRLYGKGTTIFGGCSTELSSTTKLKAWSGLNPNCWREFSGHYIVGASAYGESITNISSTITGTYTKNPSTCYGIAAHEHNVTITQGKVPTTISTIKGKPSWDVISSYPKDAEKTAEYVKTSWGSSNYTDWYSEAKHYLGGLPPDGFVTPNRKSGNIYQSGRWDYGWNSNNCRLDTTSNMGSNFFTKSNTTLPTYSSYVWKWDGDDDTNITSPKAFIVE